MDRVCRDCGRVISSTSGLQRHFERCLVRLGGRRKIPRPRPPELPEEHPATLNPLLVDHVFEDEGATASSFDNATLVDGVPSNNFDDANNSDDEYPGIPIRSGRLSTSSSVRVQSYVEETGIEAGLGVGAAGKGVSGLSDPISPYSNKSDRREIHLSFQE